MYDAIIKFLDQTYRMLISPSFVIYSPEELARKYLEMADTPLEAAGMMVRREARKTALMGFLTGLGGLITLPVEISMDLANSLAINIRLCQAIAILAGYNPEKEKVKYIILLVILGSSLKEGFVNKIVTKHLTKKALRKALKRLSIKFVEKVSEKSLSRILSGLIPVLGGVMGGGMNHIETKTAGNICIKVLFKKAKRGCSYGKK